MDCQQPNAIVNYQNNLIKSMKYVSDCPHRKENTVFVVFDLETTGFGDYNQIIQIAAKYNKQEFNCYINPSVAIPSQVSAINGLVKREDKLYHYGRPVDVIFDRREALLQFLSFLRSISESVILVAHNGFKFDAPFIFKEMKQHGLLHEFGVVKGFSDTLVLFKQILNEASQGTNSTLCWSLKQVDLAETFLGPEAAKGAHNALVDVRILDDLINVIVVKREMLYWNVKTSDEVCQKFERDSRRKECAKSYDWLKNRLYISASMVNKLAAAGIQSKMLFDTFNSGGKEAVKQILGKDQGYGITNNTIVIDKLCTGFQSDKSQ